LRRFVAKEVVAEAKAVDHAEDELYGDARGEERAAQAKPVARLRPIDFAARRYAMKISAPATKHSLSSLGRGS